MLNLELIGTLRLWCRKLWQLSSLSSKIHCELYLFNVSRLVPSNSSSSNFSLLLTKYSRRKSSDDRLDVSIQLYFLFCIVVVLARFWILGSRIDCQYKRHRFSFQLCLPPLCRTTPTTTVVVVVIGSDAFLYKAEIDRRCLGCFCFDKVASWTSPFCCV